MSVVIAIKKKGRIYMAADTQTSCGDRKMRFLGEESRKIIRLDNGILLGHVGKVHNSQIICAHSDMFTVPDDGNMTKKYVVQNIVPKLFNIYQKYDLCEKEDGEPDMMGNSYLLAYKDKLFKIDDCFGVDVIGHYADIGAGGDMTEAGLAELDADDVEDEKTVEERLADILRLSAERTMSVSGPYYLINSKDCMFKLVE